MQSQSQSGIRRKSLSSWRQAWPNKYTALIPFKSVLLLDVASWQFHNREESSVWFRSPKRKLKCVQESPRTDGMGGINSPGDTESMVANCFMLGGNNHKCTLCDTIIYFRIKVNPFQPCINYWPYFLNKKSY